MNTLSRIIVFILSLALITAYFFPIWSIDLQAPQYPEGLGMKIWINSLAGDIGTINGLNHYIGMQKIDENTIPELSYMPYLLGFIIALGMCVALTGKKWILITWVILFAMLGIAGGVDFYLWEYDYGHNLDPHAAIKIPDMNYQPPLFGSKVLLNFTAHSYPAFGGWLVIAGAFLAVTILVYTLIKNKNTVHLNLSIILFITAAFVLSSCSAGPEPIVYGKDYCDHCRMQIMDEKFGAEIVTQKGKIIKFDATECLLHYLSEQNDESKSKMKLLLVTDALNKGKLVDADKAVYIITEKMPSPMGANISAYSSAEDAKKIQQQYEGERLTWNQLKEKEF
jgi:copper chaperone NosL